MAWLKVAGFSGAVAVGFGAYGAHGLKNLQPSFIEVFKTASSYHLIHSGVLAACAMNFHGRKKNIACGLLTTGIILFSGSCYTVALLQDRSYGKMAPLGGMAFIAGWLALGFL